LPTSKNKDELVAVPALAPAVALAALAKLVTAPPAMPARMRFGSFAAGRS
jgi:hypothetical protein